MATKILLLALALLCAVSAEADTRIVNGRPTTIQQNPYVVALVYHYPRPNIYIQRCVGSLISSWHVLTTAFCFTGADLNNLSVRAGSTYSLRGGQVVGVRNVVKHPEYVQSPRSADIAVVILSRALPLSSTVNVLYIPPSGTYLPDGLQTKVVSWGFESEDGPQHEALKTITLTKIAIEECQAVYEDNESVDIKEGVICASDALSGICFGDSGAPMVYQNVLVGLSSFYTQCGNRAYPDVFTRIDTYTDWIMNVAVAPTGETPLRSAIVY